MTADELRAHGLYQCPDCLTTHTSEKALMFCCDERYDKPSYVRSYDQMDDEPDPTAIAHLTEHIRQLSAWHHTD